MSRRFILWYLLCGIVIAASPHFVLSQERPITARAATPADNSAVISVPRDGEFYFGMDKITQAEIPDKLKGAFKDKPPEGRVVYVKAGLGVTYKTVVSVIDTIRAAGFDQIALVTNADSGSGLRAKSRTRGAGKGRKARGRRHTRRI
ncbi:MAG TPA: biopolymer transporter ExbD [Pyrinomonadaceae bacterium]|jgi:biopolymer transport protein ExbD